MTTGAAASQLCISLGARVLRIITGHLKGRAIPLSPKRHGHIRLTPSRLKEALFASLEPGLEGRVFLDLCAGSGQIGLEAHSRGARVTAVEPDTRRFVSLKGLIGEWGIQGMELLNAKAQLLIPQLEQRRRRFDAIYVDPPYDATLAGVPLSLAILALLGKSSLISEGGLVMIQHSKRLEHPAEEAGLSLRRQRPYGDSLLSEYCRQQV